MFSLPTAAATEVLAEAQRSDAAGMALRVAARKIEDGSIEYGIGFDEVREGDQPREFDGLTVLVGSPSQALLADTVLDYVEVEPGQFGFVFIPPVEPCSVDPTRAHGSCGGHHCGNCG